MGASASTSNQTVDLLNETKLGLSNKTFNDIQNTCNSNTSQHNVLNIIGSNVTKLNTNQKNVGKNICVLQTALSTVQDASAQSAMMASLKSAIEQNASAGIGVAVTNSNSNTNIKNKFEANVSNETVNRAITGCINNLDQSNVMNIIGSNVTDANLDQSNDSFMQCLSNNGAKTEQTAAAAGASTAAADVTTTQTAKGLNPMDLIGGYFLILLIPCILCICVSLASSLMGGMSGGGGGGHFNMDSAGNMSGQFGPHHFSYGDMQSMQGMMPPPYQ
jgi:Tfp pilus assembly protein PilZ